MNKGLVETMRYAASNGIYGIYREVMKMPHDEDELRSILILTVQNARDAVFAKTVIEENNFDINTIGKSGGTLMHYAAGGACAEVIKYLHDRGLDVEAEDEDGETPLMVAAKGAHVEQIRALYECGADKTKTDHDGNDMLCLAAINEDPEVVTFFLNDGFEVNRKNNYGDTPLLNCASFQSNPKVMDVLILNGADTHAANKKGFGAFQLAALNESETFVNAMSYYFRSDEKFKSNFTSIEYAMLYGKTKEVVDIYLTKQKNENLLAACYNSNPDIVTAALDEGAIPIARDEDGRSALMIAAMVNDNPEVLRRLLVLGADPAAKDAVGRNFAFYAAANDNNVIYEWIRKDSELKIFLDDTDDKGNSPEYYLAHKDEV